MKTFFMLSVAGFILMMLPSHLSRATKLPTKEVMQDKMLLDSAAILERRSDSLIQETNRKLQEVDSAITALEIRHQKLE